MKRKQQFHRHAEHLGHRKRQFEAGLVIAALEEADGLRVDPDGFRKLAPGHPGIGPKHGDSIVYFPRHVCNMHHSLCLHNKNVIYANDACAMLTCPSAHVPRVAHLPDHGQAWQRRAVRKVVVS